MILFCSTVRFYKVSRRLFINMPMFIKYLLHLVQIQWHYTSVYLDRVSNSVLSHFISSHLLVVACCHFLQQIVWYL